MHFVNQPCNRPTVNRHHTALISLFLSSHPADRQYGSALIVTLYQLISVQTCLWLDHLLFSCPFYASSSYPLVYCTVLQISG